MKRRELIKSLFAALAIPFFPGKLFSKLPNLAGPMRIHIETPHGTLISKLIMFPQNDCCTVVTTFSTDGSHTIYMNGMKVLAGDFTLEQRSKMSDGRGLSLHE